jgi:hypothetical protein
VENSKAFRSNEYARAKERGLYFFNQYEMERDSSIIKCIWFEFRFMISGFSDVFGAYIKHK